MAVFLQFGRLFVINVILWLYTVCEVGQRRVMIRFNIVYCMGVLQSKIRQASFYTIYEQFLMLMFL